MYIQAHVMSGWIAANYFKLNARERFLCMVAAGIPDVDGLGILISQECYFDYHHILGHNLLFGAIIALLLTILSKHRLKAFLLYLALFHLHLAMDLVGSGECWTVAYFKPFSNYELYCRYNWALFSWQNMTVNFLFLFWTLALIITKKRTPLEYITPALDKKWTAKFNQLFSKSRN
jgi:hypothetical protein